MTQSTKMTHFSKKNDPILSSKSCFLNDMKSIMKYFVKTYILENDDAFVITMISGCFKEISEISFGPNTEIHVLKYKDVIPSNDLKQFRLNCLSFLVEVFKQMRK